MLEAWVFVQYSPTIIWPSQRPLWIMEHSQLQCHTLTQKEKDHMISYAFVSPLSQNPSDKTERSKSFAKRPFSNSLNLSATTSIFISSDLKTKCANSKWRSVSCLVERCNDNYSLESLIDQQVIAANAMSLMDSRIAPPRSRVAAWPRASQNSKICRVSKLPKSIKIAPPFRREFLSLPHSRLQDL